MTTQQQYEIADKKINEITKSVVSEVAGSESYGIMTACFINGEFVLVTNYSLDKEYGSEAKILGDLEMAASKYENVTIG